MSNGDQVLTVDVMENGRHTFSLREICERGECHAEFVITLVDYGILAPLDEAQEARRWQFDVLALSRLRTAQRLQRDLDLNLPGLAMSLDLLDEVQSLRREVARLNQRLRHQLGE
ncbi:chaperone modulator CbpM [Marinobacter sp. C2H3]|uniref:chaperone modulator CbpM n=1 Tax=Marinobacter sp. C2H3 TaxID=3119003 RepID=UPI00300EE25A